MKSILKGLCIGLLLFTFSCSDGTQVGQEVTSLMKKNKTEVIAIEMAPNDRQEYPVKAVAIDGQFLKVDDQLINLGQASIIKASGTRLEIKF